MFDCNCLRHWGSALSAKSLLPPCPWCQAASHLYRLLPSPKSQSLSIEIKHLQLRPISSSTMMDKPPVGRQLESDLIRDLLQKWQAGMFSLFVFSVAVMILHHNGDEVDPNQKLTLREQHKSLLNTGGYRVLGKAICKFSSASRGLCLLVLVAMVFAFLAFLISGRSYTTGFFCSPVATSPLAFNPSKSLLQNAHVIAPVNSKAASGMIISPSNIVFSLFIFFFCLLW